MRLLRRSTTLLLATLLWSGAEVAPASPRILVGVAQSTWAGLFGDLGLARLDPATGARDRFVWPVCDRCSPSVPMFQQRSTFVDAVRMRLWVAGGGTGTVQVFDIASLRYVDSAPLAEDWSAYWLTAAPDRSAVYAMGSKRDGTRGIARSAAGTPEFRWIPLGIRDASDGDTPLVVSADGRTGYVLSQRVLFEIDLDAFVVLRSRPLGVASYSIALDDARRTLYVADYSGRALVAVDTATLDPRRRIDVHAFPREIALVEGGRIVVADDTARALGVVDPATDSMRAAAPDNGYGFVVAPDGGELYRFRWLHIPECRERPSYDSCKALRIAVLDAATLAEKRWFHIDRESDPRTAPGIEFVVTFLATVPHVEQAVEFHHAALDHYFVTAHAREIAVLDSGEQAGWIRTGESFPVWIDSVKQVSGASGVCRFYGRPEKGLDSHFYSASSSECDDVRRRFANAWIEESASVFEAILPDLWTGACPAGTRPVYRLFNGRHDANHRYTTSPATRSAMRAQGWIVEGYGDGVAFCTPP